MLLSRILIVCCQELAKSVSDKCRIIEKYSPKSRHIKASKGVVTGFLYYLRSSDALDLRVPERVLGRRCCRA